MTHKIERARFHIKSGHSSTDRGLVLRIIKTKTGIKFGLRTPVNRLQYESDFKINKEDLMGSATHLNGNSEVNKIKNHANTMLDEGMSELNPYIKKAKEIAGEAVHKSSDFVKTYPGYAVLGAAALGFLSAAYLFKTKK